MDWKFEAIGRWILGRENVAQRLGGRANVAQRCPKWSKGDKSISLSSEISKDSKPYAKNIYNHHRIYNFYFL